MKRSLPLLVLAAFALIGCGGGADAAASKKGAVKASKPHPWSSDAPAEKSAEKPKKPAGKSAKSAKPHKNPWALDKPAEASADKQPGRDKT